MVLWRLLFSSGPCICSVEFCPDDTRAHKRTRQQSAKKSVFLDANPQPGLNVPPLVWLIVGLFVYSDLVSNRLIVIIVIKKSSDLKSCKSLELLFILKGKNIYNQWDVESREECHDRKTKRKHYKVHLHLYALKYEVSINTSVHLCMQIYFHDLHFITV